MGGSVRAVPGASVVGAVGVGLVNGLDEVVLIVGPAELLMVGVFAGTAVTKAGERAREKVGVMDWPATARARARRRTLRDIVRSGPLMRDYAKYAPYEI